MYIWINDKYSSTSFKQRLWQRKMVLIITNLRLQVMSVTLVQWSRSCLYVQINRVRLPATLFCVSLSYRFFFWPLSFNTILPFGLFSFILTADPANHAPGSIYILSSSPESYFGKGTSKALDLHTGQGAYDQKKTTRHALLWDSWSFFSFSWHHDTQHTVHQKLY